MNYNFWVANGECDIKDVNQPPLLIFYKVMLKPQAPMRTAHRGLYSLIEFQNG